jgi:hypothetical protein
LGVSDHLYSHAVLGIGRVWRVRARYRATPVRRRAITAPRVKLRETSAQRQPVCAGRPDGRGRALRHYERLVALLRDELDAEPEPETVALFDRLKQGQPA